VAPCYPPPPRTTPATRSPRPRRTACWRLKDLESAERVLGQTEDTVPDPERRLHLGALRSAIAELKTVVAAEG
jgi:hypothetical protein